MGKQEKKPDSHQVTLGKRKQADPRIFNIGTEYDPRKYVRISLSFPLCR